MDFFPIVEGIVKDATVQIIEWEYISEGGNICIT